MPSINLLDVLLVCIRGTLAVQQYIANDLLLLPSLQTAAKSILELQPSEKEVLLKNLTQGVNVEVKGILDNKEGSASVDLVTTADVLTQAFLVRLIEETTTDRPYTLIGEEESPNPTITQSVEKCYKTYFNPHLQVPHESELRAHVSAEQCVLTADTLEELRRRVGVFIDPIDGTNCFVQGVWEAPMVLVGITVDGVPVASVVNRVFLYPVGKTTTENDGNSMSYVWNYGTSPFMVFNGGRVHEHSQQRPVTPETVLEVIQSSTLKTSLFEEIDRKLQPITSLSARGAGNKEFFLVNRMLGKEGDSPALKGCDVFISSGNAIKKWDTCGPHAFILALGGDLYNEKGVPVRYQLVGDNLYSLPDGARSPSQRCLSLSQQTATVE
ncbi:inositol polyphosphate 1-phosphatase [Angomonas deanei]|nr:inositol polyphosphate 1-phosphatase [Angomonas deanei]|eukprot:EPY34356.1 inositol polyphosphate 1-phosphatase [Angomonas deanei]